MVMSCLDTLGSQVIGTLLIPREVFLLQHRVLREYGKVAVGPDFVHTFPSLVVIAALFVLAQRELNVKYFKISNKTLEKILQILVHWIIISAGLWYWLVFQRILYCCIWSHWSHEIELPHSQVIWWQRVWQSLYPPPASPSPISASFLSWILSMTISGLILHCSLHLRNLKSKCQRVISRLIGHLNAELKNIRANRCGEIADAADKSDEVGSFCDECHSNISTEGPEQPIIFQEPYGISFRHTFRQDSLNKIMRKSVNFGEEAGGIRNDTSSQQMRNQRSLLTVMSNNSREKF